MFDESKYFKYCQSLFHQAKAKMPMKLSGILGDKITQAMRSSNSGADFFERSIVHLKYQTPVLQVQKVSFTRHGKKHIGMIASEGLTGKHFTQKGVQTEKKVLLGNELPQIASSSASPDRAIVCGKTTEVELVDNQNAASIEYDVVKGINLSKEQKKVLELALMGYNIFVSGAAGTGKSVLLREIARIMKGLGINVLVTAGRALAALSIDGLTPHSIFGIGLNKCPKRHQSHIKSAAVLIIDEISLIKVDGLESIHHVFQKAKQEYRKNFGGVQVILAGDFLQCNGYGPQQMYRTSFFLQNFIHLRLKELHRLASSSPRHHAFSQVLQQVRIGKIPWSLMKDCMNMLSASSALPENSKAIRLFFDIDQGRLYNQKELDKLPEEPYQYESQFLDLSLENFWTHTFVTKLTSKLGREYWLADLEINEVAGVINSLMERRYPGYLPGLHGPLVVGFRLDDAYLRSNLYEFRQNVRPIMPSDCYCGFRAQIIAACGATPAELGDIIQQVLRERNMPVFGHLNSGIIPGTLKELVLERAAKKSLSNVELKVGVPVMLTWNLSSCLRRGSMGKVIDFVYSDQNDFHIHAYTKALKESLKLPSIKFPKVRFTNGMTEVIVPKKHSIGGQPSCKYVRLFAMHVPLELSYGISFHKIQGLTISDPIVIDFKEVKRPTLHSVYVALSRVQDPAQLTIANLQSKHVVVSKSALEFEKRLLTYDKFQSIQAETEEYQHAKSNYIVPQNNHVTQRKTPVGRKLVNYEERLRNLTEALAEIPL